MNQRKIKVIICHGIPASGKTTFAKKWVEESPETRIRVNRDDIRRMFGKYWVPKREKLVTSIQYEIIYQSIMSGYDVIVDDTNLNPKFNKNLIGVIEDASSATLYVVDIEDKIFEIDPDLAIERDKERENSVGESVILNMYNKFKEMFFN